MSSTNDKSPKKTRRQYRRRPRPEIGQRYSSLVITSDLAGRDAKGNRLVSVTCDCGQTCTRRFDRIAAGKTLSCGCRKLTNYNKHRQSLLELIPRQLQIKLWDHRGRRHTLDLSDEQIREMHTHEILATQNTAFATKNDSLLSVFSKELRHIKSNYRRLACQQAIRSIQQTFREVTGYDSPVAALTILQRELEGPEIANRIAGLKDEDKASMTPAQSTKLRLNQIAAQNFNKWGHYRSEILNSQDAPEAVRLARAVRNNLTWLKNCTGLFTHRLWEAANDVMKIVEDTMVARREFIQQRIADGKTGYHRQDAHQDAYLWFEDPARLHLLLRTQEAKERAQARARYLPKKNIDSLAERMEHVAMDGQNHEVPAPEQTLAVNSGPSRPTKGSEHKYHPEMERLYYTDYPAYVAKYVTPVQMAFDEDDLPF